MPVGGEDDCLNLEGGCLTVAVGAENVGRESLPNGSRWSSFAKCPCSLYLGVCSGVVCGAECLQTELNVVIFEPSRNRDRTIKMLFDLKKML
jgi:hypothetical protein